MKQKRRYTIGVLASGILDDYTKCVCEGILKKAAKIDVNIVIFPGKYLYRDLSNDRELMYEYQYNTAFSYAQKNNLDAIIAEVGTIGCFTSTKHIKNWLDSYKGIPIVSVAAKIEGYPSVVFDNYQGIKDGLEYLIQKVGCTKICMVGGNEGNGDARERKRNFIKILESNGIAFEDRMYVEAELSRRCIKEVRMLLDRNPEVEAIFCVNDEVAIGLYEEMKTRGLRPGKDIAVFGYDDTIVAAKASPSLSSVRADASYLGERAVELAVDIIEGRKAENVIVPTRFVRRDSFFQAQDDTDIRISSNKKSMDTSFMEIYYRYQHDDMKEDIQKLRKGFDRLNDMLIENFSNSDSGMDDYMDVMLGLEEFIKAGGVKYADVDNLLFYFERVYKELKKVQKDASKKYELSETFTILYRKVIRELNGQIGEIRADEYEMNYAMKLFAQDILQFEHGRDQSYSSLLHNLDWLQIRNAAIYMLPKPIMHLYREKFTVPDQLYVKAVLQDGIVSTVPILEQSINSKNLYNNPMLPVYGRYDRVVLPLYYNEMVYGMLYCDMSDSMYLNGEFLVNQISSAIKMIVLLQANEQIQQQLEENLTALRDHNIELDNLSKIDLLTGILNRRGFYGEAEKRIASARENNRTVIVGYVDMNNLKIINDRYGHDEGDYSLELIGNVLKEVVEDRGVAGRIGGDEYAYIVEYDKVPEEGDLMQPLYARFAEFNENSDKPYNITVSVGTYELEPSDTQTLEQALMQADAKLYEEKKKRKREVAKKK